MSNIRPYRNGFTIVELLVVIVVIGVLATITVVSFTGISNRATVASIRSDLSSAAVQLKMYYVDNGVYPTDNVCPSPGANQICLSPSAGNLFEYIISSPYTTFTLRATSGNNIWRVTENTPPGEITPITAIAAISGEAKHGSTLTAGALTPSDATSTYQWQSATTAGGTYTNIAGATQSTYSPGVSDIGLYIRVVVNGSGSYTGDATSASTSAVAVAFSPVTYYFRSDGVLGPDVTGSTASTWIVWDGGACGDFTSSADIKVEKWDTSWTVISAQGAAPRNGFTNPTITNNTINYSFPGATSVTNNLKIRVTIRGMMTGSPSNTHSTVVFTTGDLGTKFLPSGTWGIVYRTIHNLADDCGEMENEDGAWAHVFYGGSSDSRITNFGGL